MFVLSFVSDTTLQKKNPSVLKINILNRLWRHLTGHVGACHDSSAAIEHDSKHCGKTHDGTGRVVYRVTGYEDKQGAGSVFTCPASCTHKEPVLEWFISIWKIKLPVHPHPPCRFNIIYIGFKIIAAYMWSAHDTRQHVQHLRNRLLSRVRRRKPE